MKPNFRTSITLLEHLAMRVLVGGQEPNEKQSVLSTPQSIHSGALVSAGSFW
jgi:hypothetical protein